MGSISPKSPASPNPHVRTDWQYPTPAGLYPVPDDLLDLRPDKAIDRDILNPKPICGVKNIWFFWHNGYAKMPPYNQRTIRAWHCRFSKLGWVVRVVDRECGSPLNIANFMDIHDTSWFPQAFAEGTIKFDWAVQCESDLVRLPLLLKYGGVYSDVGMMQIGDLNRMWRDIVDNPASPYEIMTYNLGGLERPALTNYFFAAKPNNPLFLRTHRLLLALWAEDGGKTTTTGMRNSPLLKGLTSNWGDITFEEEGKVYTAEEVGNMLTDYVIQGQAMTMAMSVKDLNDDWDGPKYVAEHIYTVDYMVGSQLINELTAWNGPLQWELLRLKIPVPGEVETSDQKLAREIVETCLQKSFGWKLATGLITRVYGATLSSLWRDNNGSDDVPGTYAHWLRYGTKHWNQKRLPDRVRSIQITPIKVGSLLGDD